jgi:hypothetical protein
MLIHGEKSGIFAKKWYIGYKPSIGFNKSRIFSAILATLAVN